MHVTALGKVKFRGAWYANATPNSGSFSTWGGFRKRRTVHPREDQAHNKINIPRCAGVIRIVVPVASIECGWRIPNLSPFLVHRISCIQRCESTKGNGLLSLGNYQIKTFILYILTCYCRSLLYSVIACISSSPVLSVCLRICILAW